jgi:ABC-type amino acid transport substrate-binding protein
MGDEFDKWLNKGIKSELERIRIAFVPTPREQLLTALNDGRGDIVAANLTITPDRPAKSGFHHSGLERRSRNIGERPVRARNWKV